MDMIFADFSLVSRAFHDETHSSRPGCPWHASGHKTKRRPGEKRPRKTNRTAAAGMRKKKNRQAPVQEEEGGAPLRVAPRFSSVSGPASFGNAIFRL